MTRRILTRFRFSNETVHLVEALVGNHMKCKDAPARRESTLKRFFRLDRFDEHLALHRLDCLSSHRNLENYEFVRRRRDELGAVLIAPPPLLTGDDLIAAGYLPGPEFGRILHAVEDAQLEGRIGSKDEALAFVGTLKI